MIPQWVKQSVGICNCVLFIIDIALSLSMNCLLSTLRNTSTFSISRSRNIYSESTPSRENLKSATLPPQLYHTWALLKLQVLSHFPILFSNYKNNLKIAEHFRIAKPHTAHQCANTKFVTFLNCNSCLYLNSRAQTT